MIQQFEVTATEADSRLDRFLRRQVEGLTQGVIQRFLRTGKIRVNGLKVEASARLVAGDVVVMPTITPPSEMPKTRHVMVLDPGQQRDLEAMVLYRDDAVIVLNKPAGLATQGGSGISVHLDGMLDGLRFGAEERPKLVHRLDRDTSGVLLLARTTAAARQLAFAFRGRDVEKTYWALLWGVPEALAGRIDLPLLRVETGGSSRSEPAPRKHPEALKAQTDYRILDYAGKKFAWAELNPLTGRMHQLRAHCLALGTPILGDAAYGAAFADGFAPQLHLHARRLSVPHPDGGTLTVEAPPAKHLHDGLVYLGFTIPDPAKPQHRG
ncbi:RluA family pseudouridine synthase [Acidocella sp.]|jgi:23S rRNA pseudouridine955/2504/2580 synthase|uniref:RluA family pseudouridine synthase n=1 Tax=Acidocella sp. TaxID=50710 RepID=UPI002F41FDED